MQIDVLPLGAVSKRFLRRLNADLRRAGVGVTPLPRLELPAKAFVVARDQYLASDLLETVRRSTAGHVLAVTDVDLFADPLNFVFGQADVGGRVAIISLHRLRSEEAHVFRLRALTEALHELGHNAGLDHCQQPTCVMFLSNGLGDTDRKGPNPCARCMENLGDDVRWHLAA